MAFDPARAETAAIDVDGLAAMLGPLLPDGIEVTAAAAGDPRIGSLQQEVDVVFVGHGVLGRGREADARGQVRAAAGGADR